MSGFVHRPSGDFAPAGESLSWAPKKVTKQTAPDPPALRCASGPLRCSVLEPARRTHDATLCSSKRRESEVEASFARGLKALRFSAGSEGEIEIPRCERLSGLAVGCSAVPGATLQNRREAQKPRACAKRTSRTDSRRLSERSERSERSEFGPALGFERRRGARRAGFAGAISLLTFLFAQESESAAGTKSRHGPWRQTELVQAERQP